MEIRLAKEEDIEQILALQTQIYRVEKLASGASQSLKNQLEDKTCDILVAEYSGKILSTCVIYYIEVPARNRPYAFLEGLVVDESARGKGIGTKMFDKIFELAKSRNCYKILFTSSEQRKEAHNLYERLGFKKWGVEFRMDL